MMDMGLLQSVVRPNFIETGTFRGLAIQMALNSGFQNIHSVEINPYFYHAAKLRHRGDPRVNMYLGDSAAWLPVILGMIMEPSVIWLDAHPHDTPEGPTPDNCPILKELDALVEHPIKDHVILIDDIDVFSADGSAIRIEQIMDRIESINPRYEASKLDSGPYGILVCKMKEETK